MAANPTAPPPVYTNPGPVTATVVQAQAPPTYVVVETQPLLAVSTAHFGETYVHGRHLFANPFSSPSSVLVPK